MHILFERNIFENNLINKGDNVLIGISGGPDSVFLFHNLILLKEKLSFNLYASHINHMYRGEDALLDENFVRKLCNEYNVQLFIKRKNAREYAKELKITEEEAGRILRYNFFRQNLNEIGGGKIAVAHNLNDQSETVLQRIIRGTGLDGLKAMSFMNDGIIRPILNIQKSDILTYLHEKNLEYCIDKTNEQAIYGRNKIRLDLIPYLEENFNPNIQNALYRLSQAAESDSKIIEKYINIKYNEALIKEDINEIILSLNALIISENYEIGRIIRRAIENLKGFNVNIEMKHINYAIDFVRKAKTGKKINISDGINIEISYNNVIFSKIIEKIPQFKYNIVLEQPLLINEIGKTVLCKVVDKSEINMVNSNSINLDYHKVQGGLTIRNRRIGDSMVPCGMTGTQKVKDIFINMKIPAKERDKKLILADEKNILWIEGFRIHNDYKVTNKTNKILNILLEEVNEIWHKENTNWWRNFKG